MSKSVNKVILVGNLTRDPETSYRQELAIAKLGIATNERRKDQSTGEWKDMPEFHNVTFFGKLGEIVEKYLKKGSKIYVEGSLRTSSWDDKETGVKKYRTEVIGNELLMLGSNPQGQQSNDFESQSSDSDTPFPNDDNESGLTDEEIPF